MCWMIRRTYPVPRTPPQTLPTAGPAGLKAPASMTSGQFLLTHETLLSVPTQGRVPSSPEVPNTIPYSFLHQLFVGVYSSPGPDLVLGDPETNRLLLSPVQQCPSSSVQLTKCHQPLRAHLSTFCPTKLPDSSQQSQPLPALGQHFPCASHTVPRH